MFEAEGVHIRFTDDAIEAIAQTAFDVNAEMENIGARRLQTVISRLLNEHLFDVPDKADGEVIIRRIHPAAAGNAA